MGSGLAWSARRRQGRGRAFVIVLLWTVTALFVSPPFASAYLGRPASFSGEGIGMAMPQLFGVAANAADEVYVVDPVARQVQRYTARGAFLGNWGDVPLGGPLAD